MLTPAVKTVILSPSYSPEAKDYFSRLPNAVSVESKKRIDALIRRFVACGYFDKADVIYLFAQDDASNALVNLKPIASASFNATPVNGVTFTTNQGYTSSIVGTRYLDTNYNILSASKFLRDSAHIGFYSRTDYNGNVYDCGCFASPLGTNIMARQGGSANMILNNESTVSAVTNDSLGLYIGIRSSSSTISLYKNGGLLVTNTNRVSSERVNLNLYIGCYNNNGTPYGLANKQYSFFTAGGSLSTDQQLEVYNSLSEYLITIGANV